MTAVEFSPSPPHPLRCAKTLPPRVEKGRKPPPSLSFSTIHALRSTISFFYTPHASPLYSPNSAPATAASTTTRAELILVFQSSKKLRAARATAGQP